MKSRLLPILVVLVILATIVPLSVGAAGGKTRFDWVVTKRLTVKNASEFLDALDLNGNDLIIDADGDSILDEESDDVIRMTLGDAAGTFSVLTGNLAVGNGTPDVSLNGEDAYCEGTLEVDGAVRFDSTLDQRGNVSDGGGIFTIADDVLVDGQADAIQFRVQGYTTQTTSLLVLEQHDGTDKFTVSDDGNMLVAGTSNLQGNLSDSGGTLTIADDALIDGQADAEQLVVQGYTTQTNSPFVVEQSDGTDVATVSNAGALYLGSTLDVRGDISDGAGVLTVADNMAVTGQADVIQLVVTGHTTQTTDDLFVVQINGGTDVLAIGATAGMDLDAAADISGATSLASTLAQTLVNIAGASANPYDYTGTLGIMDGSDDFTLFDVNITNADHTGASNTVQAIDIAGITGDADATESAIMIGAGWDVGLSLTDNRLDFDTDDDTSLRASADDVLTMELGGSDVVTFKPWPAAAGSAIMLALADTAPTMDGNDAVIGIEVALASANHTGTGNSLAGILLSLASGDAQVAEKAIDVTDDDWTYAIDAGDNVVFSSAQTWFSEFLGGTIEAELLDLTGADPQAVIGLVDEQYGIVQLTSGDANTGCITDCVSIGIGTAWQADQGGLVYEVRVHIDTTITNGILCVGLTDLSTLQMPATIGGGDALTTNATDGVFACFDDAADTDEWFFIGVDTDVDATGSGATGIAPVADTYQILRIEVDAGGEDARLYIDGTLAGTLTANVVAVTVALNPVVVVDTNAASSVVVDLDYIYTSSKR